MVLTNTWTCILHANETPDAGCFWVPPQCCHFPWKKAWFSSQCCLGLILKFSWEGMVIFTPAWLSICKVVALLHWKWLHSRQLPEELSAQWRQLCQDLRRTEVGVSVSAHCLPAGTGTHRLGKALLWGRDFSQE